MKILLVNPATQRYTRTYCTPMGILSIATFLEVNGHTVKVLNRAVKSTDIEAEISSFRPDFVGLSMISVMSFNDAILVSRTARKYGAVVVWGGPFVSSSPEICADIGCMDLLSIGEGEATWLELVNTKRDGGDIYSLPGTAYKKDGRFVRMPDREFMDLSVLPPINYDQVDIEPLMQNYYGYDRIFGMYLSKGCPFHCTFCYNTYFHKNCRRERPVEALISEAKSLRDEHGIKGIVFGDELFGGTRDNTRRICNAFIDNDLGLVWGCMTRTGIFDKDDFDLMYKAGCRWMEFGVETGSPEMIKKIKKGVDPERVAPDILACHDAGIITLCYFIVGLPDETEEQLRETCALVNKLSFSHFVCSYYNPLPNTEIVDDLISQGRFALPTSVKPYMKTKIFYSPKPNFSSVSSRDLKVVRSYILWRSFSRRRIAPGEKKTHAVAKKDIVDALELLRGHGLRASLQQFFISAYEFLDIFCYANFFPKTVKKYGLDIR